MGGKTKRARLSPETYAARAAAAPLVRDSLMNYCEAIGALVDDARPAEELYALAKTYGDALADHIRQIERYISVPQAELDNDVLGILDPVTIKRVYDACWHMAWVLSDCIAPDFDAINKWLARGTAVGDSIKLNTKKFYEQCSLNARENPADAFSYRACSIYREYARVDPVRGGVLHALGLLSQTPVDAAAVAGACKRCREKRLLVAFATANTRAEFEHAIVVCIDDYISLRDCGRLDLHIRALMDRRFGPTGE